MIKNVVMRGLTRIALAPGPVGLIGRKRRGGVDRDLDPQVAAVLELQRMLKLPALDSLTPAKARRLAEEGLSPLDAVRLALVKEGHLGTLVNIRV